MYKITYKIRVFDEKCFITNRAERYHVTCETIEQALQLASDFLLFNYEIISIRKI